MRKLMLTLAAVGAFLPSAGYPLGLGEIRVNSALNEPLNAEVDILAARPGEVEELIVSLADSDTFDRAGLDRPYVLTKLRFEVERRSGGQPYIRIFTRESVREPFLSFLVEADWAKGRVIREFTILLDPPVLTVQQPSRPVTPAPMAAPEPAPMAAAEPEPEPMVEPAPMAAPEPAPMAATDPEPMPAPEPAPMAAAEPEAAAPSADAVAMTEATPEPQGPPAFDSEQTRFPLIPIDGEARAPAPPAYAGPSFAGDEYGPVAENQTLWSIAQETRQDDVSMSQMMLAYLRANPEAFVDGNVNRLRKGYVLRVPSREEATAVGRDQALAQVQEQNGLWREYVARVSGQTTPQAVGGGEPGPAAGATQTAQTDDSKLTLVAATQEGEGASGTDEAGLAEELRNKLALSEEALEAARVENQELRERIGMLEEQVSKMQRLIELKQDELAELQMMQRQGETAEAPAEPVVPEAETETSQADEAPVEPIAATPADEPQAEMQAGVEPEPAGPQAVDEEPVAEPAPMDEVAEAEGDEGVAPVAAAETEASEPVEPAEAEPVAESGQPAEQAVEAPEPQPEPVVTAANEGARDEPGIIQQYLPFLSGIVPSGAGQMLGNPMTMGAAVGVPLVLLLGGTMIYLRRRQSGEPEAAEGGALSFEDTGDLGEESEDTGLRPAPDDPGPDMTTLQDITDITAPGGDFTKTELDEAAQAGSGEDDKDDTVSEVDVYLAYGLFQQAEDLLRDVIKENPDREDYRIKLLETHYAAKNKEAFLDEAQAFHEAMGGSEGPHWERVLAMGAELAPDHALFSGADAANLEAPAVDFAKPESPDIGLTEDDTETRATDVELDEAFSGAGNLSMTQSLDLDEIGALPDGDEADERAGASAELDALDSTETEFLTSGEDDTQTEILAEGDELGLGEASEDEGEGLEFDLGELGGEQEAEFVKTADEAPLNADELELPGADQPEPEESSADFEKTMMALPDFELPGESEAASPTPEVDADLTDVDITEPGLDETVALSSGGDEDDLALPEDVDEVGTKLDLAKAFIDMGDTDGARGTLEEVLAEGNDDQKAEAQRLMQQV